MAEVRPERDRPPTFSERFVLRMIAALSAEELREVIAACEREFGPNTARLCRQALVWREGHGG